MKSSITCLSISTPLTGVRNTGDKSDPNFESNDMVLWESGEKDATPATFDKDKELQLIAKVNFSEAADYAGKALSLEATFVPHKYYPDDLHVDGTSRFTLPENHDSIEMDVVFTLAHRSPVYENLETPWGLLGGGLTFTVTASPDMSQSMGTVPIELYGIIGKLFQQFSDEGIPKDLLLTWVMPTLMHGVKTEKEWIKWAVNRCHRSEANLTVIIDDLGDCAIHTFRYDTFSTTAFYSTELGTDFSLDRWLRNRKSTKPFRVLNCYDCAAIVAASVSLGLDLQRLKWQSIRPFGVFPYDGAVLIGWGVTNSCHGWGESPQGKRKLPDNVRAPFSNHSFASVEIGWRDMALDACAGPAVGEYDMKTYIERNIDHTEGLLKRVAPNYQKQPEVYRAGMYEDLAPKGNADKGTRMQEGWSMNQIAKNANNDEWVDDVLSENLKKTIDAISTVNHTPPKVERVNIGRLIKLLKEEMWEKFADGNEKPVIIPTIARAGGSIDWEFGGIMVRFVVCKDNKSAKAEYNAKIAGVTNPSEMFTAPQGDTTKGGCHTRAKTSNKAEIWVHGNIFISVGRQPFFPSNQPELTVEYVAEWIYSQLKPDVLPTPAELSDPQVVGSDKLSPVIHEIFSIEVRAPGASDVSIRSKHGVVSFREIKHMDGDLWKFTLVSGEAKMDEVYLIALGADDLMTKSVSVRVDVQKR